MVGRLAPRDSDIEGGDFISYYLIQFVAESVLEVQDTLFLHLLNNFADDRHSIQSTDGQVLYRCALVGWVSAHFYHHGSEIPLSFTIGTNELEVVRFVLTTLVALDNNNLTIIEHLQESLLCFFCDNHKRKYLVNSAPEGARD